jgi:hypothetical protein
MTITPLVARFEAATQACLGHPNIPEEVIDELIEAESAVLLYSVADRSELEAKIGAIDLMVDAGNWEAVFDNWPIIAADVRRVIAI